MTIRNSHSVRPWQHVLNPLSGCICLAQRLVRSDRAFAEGWNLSPTVEDPRPVSWLVEGLRVRWPGDLSVRVAPDLNDPHEARLVTLDASIARERLGWTPRWSLDRRIEAIVDWYDAHRDGRDPRVVTFEQIEAFGR